MMTFIEKFERLCRLHGLSERAAANRIGVNQSAISRWRSRGSLPRPSLAKKLADFFDTPVEILLNDDIEIPTAVLWKPVRKAAEDAKKEFSNNEQAAQVSFDFRLLEKAHRATKATAANIFREKSAQLRKLAAELDEHASKIENSDR